MQRVFDIQSDSALKTAYIQCMVNISVYLYIYIHLIYNKTPFTKKISSTSFQPFGILFGKKKDILPKKTSTPTPGSKSLRFHHRRPWQWVNHPVRNLQISPNLHGGLAFRGQKSMGSFGWFRYGCLVSGCPRKCPPKKKRDLFWLEVVSCWVNSCEQKSIGVEVDQCIIRLGFYAAAHRQGFRVTQPFLIYEGS